MDSSCHDQIKFEFCPTIEFVKYYMKKHNLSVDKRDIYDFEIKDDRDHMRYQKTSRDKYYSQLVKIVKYLQDHGKNVCYLSHDGSNSFKSYLNSKGIKVGSMSNAYSTAEKIILNYLKIDKLFCMAGHSQMIGHALDCDVISLISHNKQKYFLQDTDLYGRDRHVNVNTEDVYNKLLKILNSPTTFLPHKKCIY